MIVFLAAQTLASAASPQQTAVLAYQNCLAPIVRANELGGEDNYKPLEVILSRIATKCTKERAAAREALAFVVTTYHPELPQQPTEAEKEELIRDATIRWANNAVAQLVSEESHAQD